VQLDTLFKTLDDDMVERLSVAELVAHASKLFGFALDPTVRWPEWAELRGESPPDGPPEPPPGPAKAKRSIPAHLSGASTLGLNDRTPPDLPLIGRRERGPP
jgi:hypothetical protein